MSRTHPSHLLGRPMSRGLSRQQVRLLELLADGKLRLISLSEKGRAEHDLEGADAVRARVQVVYSPHTGMITTSVNGRELVSNDAGIMVIAPSEITIGENDVRFSATMPRFTGGIRDANKIVRPDGTVPPQHISELH